MHGLCEERQGLNRTGNGHAAVPVGVSGEGGWHGGVFMREGMQGRGAPRVARRLAEAMSGPGLATVVGNVSVAGGHAAESGPPWVVPASGGTMLRALYCWLSMHDSRLLLIRSLASRGARIPKCTHGRGGAEPSPKSLPCASS